MSWLVVLIYAALLIVITLVPWSVTDRVSQVDFLMHFAAWAVLSFLTSIAVRGRARSPIRIAALASIGAIVFGVLIETLQPLTGRTSDVVDLAADAIGAIAGAVLGAAAMWFKCFPADQSDDAE